MLKVLPLAVGVVVLLDLQKLHSYAIRKIQAKVDEPVKLDKGHIVAGVLIVGAVVVLYLQLKGSTLEATPGNVQSQTDNLQPVSQNYPTVPASQNPAVGAVNVGGSPLYLTYNIGKQTPTDYSNQAAEGCGCDGDCSGAGQGSALVPRPTQLPPEVIAAAHNNLLSAFNMA